MTVNKTEQDKPHLCSWQRCGCLCFAEAVEDDGRAAECDIADTGSLQFSPSVHDVAWRIKPDVTSFVGYLL